MVDYKIPFRGLENGKHQYEFNIDNKFFEGFEHGDISKGRLIAKVELNKRSTGIESFFDLSGVVTLPCDRCLDDLECQIEYQGKLFFEFGHESEEVSDELVMLSPSDNFLELDVYIYEFIVLNLPIQRIHPDDEEGNSYCNPEMIATLNNMIVNKDDEEIDDPRWDKLRDLIN